MRIRTLAIVALMSLLSTMAWAQQEKQPMDIPVYPGAETSMEVNLSNEDILPMAKAMLPMLGDKFGKLAEKISPEDVAAIFKDVRRIELLQLDVTKPGVTDSNVAEFYAKNLPSGRWNRVFFQSQPQTGIIGLYAQDGAEMLYGFRVRSVKSDDKTIRRVEIAKTEGKVDFVKLLTLAGKYIETTKSAK